jgi:hypothetical protein
MHPMQLLPALMQEADTFVRANELGSCVGMHLRGSDHLRKNNKPTEEVKHTIMEDAMRAVKRVLVDLKQPCK